MKKFRNLLLALVIAAMILPLAKTGVNAEKIKIETSRFEVSGASISGSVITALSRDTVTLRCDVSSDLKQILGQYGGQVTVSCSFKEGFADGSTGNVNYTSNFSGGKTVTAEDLKGAVYLEITLNIQNSEKFDTLTISDISITSRAIFTAPPATETEEGTVTATPDGTPENTPEGTPDGEVTPTPEGTPDGTPDGEVTPTPESEVTPTKKPSTSEKTNDHYSPSHQTQAPPTIPPEVTVDPDSLPTPVPEATIDAMVQQEKRQQSDPTFALLMLFLGLFLLLAVDIAIIIYRKQMGYEHMINNGISRRKIKDVDNSDEE